jgi:hypothetical protein
MCPSVCWVGTKVGTIEMARRLPQFWSDRLAMLSPTLESAPDSAFKITSVLPGSRPEPRKDSLASYFLWIERGSLLAQSLWQNNRLNPLQELMEFRVRVESHPMPIASVKVCSKHWVSKSEVLFGISLSDFIEHIKADSIITLMHDLLRGGSEVKVNFVQEGRIGRFLPWSK